MLLRWVCRRTVVFRKRSVQRIIICIGVALVLPCFWLSYPAGLSILAIAGEADNNSAEGQVKQGGDAIDEPADSDENSEPEIRYFPGQRVMVMTRDATVRDGEGKLLTLELGVEFKIRTVEDEDEFLIGFSQGEGRILAKDVLPIDLAAAEFQKIVDEHPDDAAANFALAKAWYYDDLERAIPRLRKAVQLAPKNPHPCVYLGMALGRIKGSEAARDEYFQKARELGPNDPTVLTMIACYWQFHTDRIPDDKVAGVVQDLKRAIELSPASGAPYNLLCQLLSKQSTPLPSEAVLALADQGIRADPTNPGLNNLRGLYYLRLGDQSQSLGDLNGAVDCYQEAEKTFGVSLRHDVLSEFHMFNRALALWNRSTATKNATSEDVLALRLSALCDLSDCTYRNWRYIPALKQCTHWFGSNDSETRFAFRSVLTKFLEGAEGADAAKMRVFLMLLTLDIQDVHQGILETRGMDFCEPDFRFYRMSRNAANASLSMRGEKHDLSGERGERCRGKTALDILCKWHPHAAVWALANSADPNISNVDGSKPIHTVVSHSEVPLDLLQSLVNLGADLEATSPDGKTPLGLCLSYSHEMAARLLRVSGASWGKLDDEKSAIHAANVAAGSDFTIRSQEDADRWLTSRCETEFKEAMLSLTKWYESSQKLEAPKLAVAIPYSSIVTDGEHPHEKARRQNAEFERWYDDWQSSRNTEQQLQEMADELKMKKKQQFDFAVDNLVSSAALLISPQFADELAKPIRK